MWFIMRWILVLLCLKFEILTKTMYIVILPLRKYCHIVHGNVADYYRKICKNGSRGWKKIGYTHLQR